MARGQSDLTVRIDDDLKASGEELFRSLGMNFSTAFNVFVKQSVKHGKIPFEIDDEPEPIESGTAETEEDYYAEIRRRVADIDAGLNIVHHNPLVTAND